MLHMDLETALDIVPDDLSDGAYFGMLSELTGLPVHHVISALAVLSVGRRRGRKHYWPGETMNAKTLRERYPDIPWDEPVQVSRTDRPEIGARYACRICIARRGLHASVIPELPTDPEIIRKHIRDVHS